MNDVPGRYYVVNVQGVCVVVYPQLNDAFDPQGKKHKLNFRLAKLGLAVPEKQTVIDLYYDAFKLRLVTVEVD